MNVNVNSGDGNSIFEIAAKFQQMQLREISKNIETIKQKLRSGEDTDSTKFIDDLDKLNGLMLQLVKTGFTISENLDEKIEDNMNDLITKNNNIVTEIRTNLEEEAVQTVALYNDRIKAYKTLEDIDERFLYLTALKAYAKDKLKVSAPKKVVEEYDFFIINK